MNGKIIIPLLIPFLLGLLMACNQADENESAEQQDAAAQAADSASAEASAAPQQPASKLSELLSHFSTLEPLPVKITSSFENEAQSQILKGKAVEKELSRAFFKPFYVTTNISADVPIRAVYKIPLSDSKMGLIVRLITDEDYNSDFYLAMLDLNNETIGESMLLANLELSGGSDAAEINTEISKLGTDRYQLAVTYSSSELMDGEREETEEVTGYTLDATGITKIEE